MSKLAVCLDAGLGALSPMLYIDDALGKVCSRARSVCCGTRTCTAAGGCSGGWCISCIRAPGVELAVRVERESDGYPFAWRWDPRPELSGGA